MFRKIVLLATDGSMGSRRAGRMAIDLADGLDLALHLVHVAPVPGVYAAQGELTMTNLVDPDLQSKLRQRAEGEAREVLEDHTKGIEEAGGEVAQTHAGIGRPDAEIVRLAEELDAGVLVVGDRGSGPFKRVAIGSVADSVVRNAHCPVLVARVNGSNENH